MKNSHKSKISGAASNRIFDSEKRGISPVVATILLVAIAIVAFVFILAWTRGFIQESIAKFNEPVENSCERVLFNAMISEDNQLIYINNQGNVPIYGFNVELSSAGKSETGFIRPDDGNVYSGASDSIRASTAGQSVKITPVLLGEGKNTGSGKLYPCSTKAQVLR